VFHDSLLYPKQLSLLCLLRLISASADRIGYITNFTSMVGLLHELKNSNFQHGGIQAFDNVSAGKKKLKSLLDFYTYKKLKVFLRALYAFPILV